MVDRCCRCGKEQNLNFCSTCNENYCENHRCPHFYQPEDKCRDAINNVSANKDKFDILHRIKANALSEMLSTRSKLLNAINTVVKEYSDICKDIDSLILSLNTSEECFNEWINKAKTAYQNKLRNKYNDNLIKLVKKGLKQFKGRFHQSSASERNLVSNYSKVQKEQLKNNKSLSVTSENIKQLNLNESIGKIKDLFNANINFFEYYRKSNFQLIETVILALFENIKRYLSKQDQDYILLEIQRNFNFQMNFEEIFDSSNQRDLFTDNCMSVVNRLIASGRILNFSSFAQFARMQIMDFQTGNIWNYSLQDRYLSIFIIRFSNYNLILMPKQRYYLFAKYFVLGKASKAN